MTTKQFRRPGWFWDQIFNAVGEFVELETTESGYRSGKLTGTRHRTVKLNGEEVDLITHLEMNNDPTDCLEVDRIISISIQ